MNDTDDIDRGWSWRYSKIHIKLYVPSGVQ